MKAKVFNFVRGLSNGTPPRFQSYLKSLTLILTLLLSVNVAWGQRLFTAITSTDQLSTGDSVVIAIQDGATKTKWWALQVDKSDNLKGDHSNLANEVSDNTITNPDKSIVWKVTKTEGLFKFENTPVKATFVFAAQTGGTGCYTTIQESGLSGTQKCKWYITHRAGIYFIFQIESSTGRYAAANAAESTLAKLASYVGTSSPTVFPQATNGTAIAQGAYEISIFKKQSCTTDLDAPVVTATPGNGSATLTWAAVEHATKYQVSWNGGAFADATSPYVRNSLTNDVTYTWKVKAIGGGIYCDNEEATGNVTPSANHTVAWYVDGEVYTEGSPTTEVVHGGKVTTLPTPPAVPTACTGSVFVGWTDHTVTNGNKPSPLFKDAASAPIVNANATYHAVFADPE